jgi:hypothetical protein
MSDALDEMLHDHGRQWRAAQPDPLALDVALQSAKRVRRSPRTTLAIFVSVVAVSAIAAVSAAFAIHGSSSDHQPQTGTNKAMSSSPLPTSAPTTAADPVLQTLASRAHDAAVANGDPQATAEAVKTTYADAERVVLDGDSSSNPSGSTPVWVIQLRGMFTCGDCGGLASAATAKGRAVALVIDARTFDGYDSVFSAAAHDLSALGRVIALPTQ